MTKYLSRYQLEKNPFLNGQLKGRVSSGLTNVRHHTPALEKHLKMIPSLIGCLVPDFSSLVGWTPRAP